MSLQEDSPSGKSSPYRGMVMKSRPDSTTDQEISVSALDQLSNQALRTSPRRDMAHFCLMAISLFHEGSTDDDSGGQMIPPNFPRGGIIAPQAEMKNKTLETLQ